MSQIPAIRTTELGRSFGSLAALDGLTMEIPPGEIFGLLGLNGAGKTTLLRILLGVLEPSRGQAEVLGYDVRFNGASIRARCGALLEHCGLYERMTAEENLELFGRIFHMQPLDRRARVQELLVGLGLWERRRDLVSTWSRGMKQRLALARAILHRPALVFLDEPTAGLDPVAARTVRDDLRDLARSTGVTVFITTHHLAEAAQLCSLVGVLSGGRLVSFGPPAEVAPTCTLEDAFLGLVEAHR